MRSALSIVVAILVGQLSHAQGKKPWDVDCLGGRLEHVQTVPGSRNPNSFSEKRKTLRGVSLRLYDEPEDQSCCRDLTLVETVQTGKDGRFNFKTMKPGNFWLVTNWSGREYKLAVVYKPQKNPASMCSQQGIALDDEGNAGWWLAITVD